MKNTKTLYNMELENLIEQCKKVSKEIDTKIAETKLMYEIFKNI